MRFELTCNMINVIIFMFLVVLLAGCATVYNEPDGSVNTSLLQLDLVSMDGGSDQGPTYPFVYISAGGECEKGQLINYDFDHFFMEGNPVQFKDDRWVDIVGYKIRSDIRTLLFVYSKATIAQTHNSISYGYCKAPLKFTPKTGETYRLFYDGGRLSGDRCKINLKKVVAGDDGEILVPVKNVVSEWNKCQK